MIVVNTKVVDNCQRACSAVVSAPVVEATHPRSNPSCGSAGCGTRGFSPHTCFMQVLDTRVALQWADDVPVIYEACVALVISRWTFEVYRL